MQKWYSRSFVWSAGAILLATGLAKVWSGFGHDRILAAADPLLGISFGKLMLLVGAGELVIAALCISTKIVPGVKVWLVAWMATNFLVYRIGLWFVGWHHPCGCMGTLAGALHLSDQAADNIMKGVLACLLVGSYLALLLQWRADRLRCTPAAGGGGNRGQTAPTAFFPQE